MRSGINSKSKWVIAVTMAVAMVAGGLAIGSNMGFKFNAQIVSGVGASPKLDNWLSLPDNSPYVKANNVCTSLGLTATGANSNRGVVSRLISSTGGFANYTCGAATVGAFTLVKGEAIKIRNNVPLGPTINSIVVGADDPSNTIPIQSGVGASPKFDNWVSVPYHTTAVKANDLCTDMGLTATGPNSTRGVVSRLIASTGGFANYTCGAATVGAFAITVGEGIKVRNPSGAKSWLASHF